MFAITARIHRFNVNGRKTRLQTVRSKAALVSIGLTLVGCAPRKVTPDSYLQNALKVIQNSALNSTQVDWSNVKTKCKRIAAGAKTTADTYPAINYALHSLKDHHSFLLDAAGKSTAHAVEEQEITDDTFVIRQTLSEIPKISTEDFFSTPNGVVARIRVKKFKGDNQAATKFARAIQDKIAEANDKHPIGWLVDLRGNHGGNMWPMLVGVGPILGTSLLGYFQRSNGPKIQWYYEYGTSGTIQNQRKHPIFTLPHAISDVDQQLPVAVLLDRDTASSGEAVAIAFVDRPNTRSFGEATAGLSTANTHIPLSDGANIILTVSEESDRSGKRYPQSVKPDQDVATSAKEDRVVNEAVNWIFSKHKSTLRI